MKLPVLTIGVYQAENQDGDQVPLKELRAAARHDMQRYRENLSTENISNGDSIVRNYFPIDHSYFVIEQDISIAVVQVGNSWTALVCSDIGKDLYSGPSGPWQSSSDCNPGVQFPIELSPVDGSSARQNRTSTLGSFRKWSALGDNYGKSLDVELMEKSSFYALTEIFKLSAASESRFLNFLELKMSPDGGLFTNSTLEETQSQAEDILTVLEGQRRHVREIISSLTDKGLSNWPGPPLQNQEQRKKIQVAATSISEDFIHLEARINSCKTLCSDKIALGANYAMMRESEIAIQQSQRIARLTTIAFFFVPMSFTTSIFGMNITEISMKTMRFWFGGIFIILAFSALIIIWDHPHFERSQRKSWKLIKSFMRSVNFLKLHKTRSISRSPKHERVAWMCECGTNLLADMKHADDNDPDQLRQMVGVSNPFHGYQGERKHSLPLGEETFSAPNKSGKDRTGIFGIPSLSSRSDARTLQPLSYPAYSRPTKSSGPRYLELCVNTGFMKRCLSEIDLTGVGSDGEMFMDIRHKYWDVRRLSFPYNLLTKPVKFKYVKFRLEDRHRVWILEESPPPITEITAGRYHYDRPQMPTEAFFHYFYKSDSATHVSACWINHLPKKLGCSILSPQPDLLVGRLAAMPTAWGILIEEQLNQRRVFWLVIIPLMLLDVGLTIFWSKISGNRTEGLTAGALLATILAIIVVSLYKMFEQS